MTDIHSHILFNVDDGSKSIEESITLLKELKNIGFDNIILTPHYIDNPQYNNRDFQVSNEEKLKKIATLKEAIKKHHLDINIFLGNEIFINNNIIDLINSNQIYPLNNTKYLLIELPFRNYIPNLENIINEIQNNGYIPVIAHPERYSYFQDNYELVDSLKSKNILFQCNYASILGYYRQSAQKLFRYMLKKRYVDFLGTDLHHTNRMYVVKNFKKIDKVINKIAGKDYYNQIKENCNNLIK